MVRADYKIIALGLASLLLTACGGSNSNSDLNVSRALKELSIPFGAVANGESINCDAQLSGLGTANNGSNAQVKDFRFYVHDLRLVRDNGAEVALTMKDDGKWQNGTVALVSFQNKDNKCSGASAEIHPSVQVSLPDDGVAYKALRFKVGVPSSQNHLDTSTGAAAPPLNVGALAWSWRGGRKFMRLDVAPAGGITRPSKADYSATSWNIHLGSTGCTGDNANNVSCPNLNVPEIEVALSNNDLFTNSKVVLDYAELVSGSNLAEDLGGAPGCMSGKTDPECNALFTKLGLDLNTGLATGNQTVFSVQ